MGDDDTVDATLDGTRPPLLNKPPDTFDEVPLQPFDWLTSAASIGSLLHPLMMHDTDTRILHVGCGSSVLGEWIVEQYTSQISKVVNVDCDVDTLRRMQQRWRDRMALVNTNSERLHYLSEDMMEFSVADFTVPNALSSMDATPFDIIVDKSTLDCMLCTDTGAIGLLMEVYRLLKENAVYLVVSFHPPEFIQNLLAELPGADWEVACSLLPRQMEERTGPCSHANDLSLSEDDSLPVTTGCATTVTVLHCRRRHRKLPDTGLDWDTVYHHVHSVNQKWYQQINPLITSDRIQLIERVFADAGEDLNLRQCYQLLFTDGERENLDYDDFVGDWMSYLLELSAGSSELHSELPVDRMSFATAIKFLQAMQ
jgi:SAM-dependent methyltransferase